MSASTRSAEQEAVATATHPGACPLVEAYDAVFAVEVASTMSA